jgi:hypothetical protein
MRSMALALSAAALLGASFVSTAPASAQTLEVGPGGQVGVDLRSPRQRERDQLRREDMRDRDVVRRSRDDDYRTGSVRSGCREVTVRERDDDGSMVTRTRRDCR